jgi:hypothetical protein
MVALQPDRLMPKEQLLGAAGSEYGAFIVRGKMSEKPHPKMIKEWHHNVL